MLSAAGASERNVSSLAIYKYSQEKLGYIYKGGNVDAEKKTVTLDISEGGQYILAIDNVAPKVYVFTTEDDSNPPVIIVGLDEMSDFSEFSLKIDNKEVVGLYNFEDYYDANAQVIKYAVKNALAPGTHKITLMAADAAGNKMKSEAVLEITIPINSPIPEPNTVYVKAITLNKTRETITTGSTFLLKSSISPSNATNKKVSWKSDNEKIAKVSSDGVVTGETEGTTNITVATEDGNKTASCMVTVKDQVKVEKVKLNKKSVQMKIGGTLKLKATISPKNATNKSLKWTSSNKKVATVNKSGKVTAKGPGKATITATAQDGSGVNAKATITVSGVTLNTSKLVVQNGKTNKAVKYTLTKDKIKSVKANNKNVTVKTKGKTLQITGKKIGKSTITVTTKGGAKAKLTVTVQKGKVTTKTLKVLKSSVSVKKGGTVTVKVTTTPDKISTGEKITIKNSNKKVASYKIDQKSGKISITGKKKGTCKLTVKAGKKSKKITVKVSK